MQRSEAPCGVALDFLPGVWGTITWDPSNATLEKIIDSKVAQINGNMLICSQEE